MSFEDTIRAIVREEFERALRCIDGKREERSVPEPMTIAEAASFAKVSSSTIRKWLAEKKLTKYGRGRYVRVERAEVMKVLATMATETGAPPSDSEIESKADAILRNI